MRVWVRIVGDNPLVGTMADGQPVSPGQRVEVSATAARLLVGAGRAVMDKAPVAVAVSDVAGDPVAAAMRGRVR